MNFQKKIIMALCLLMTTVFVGQTAGYEFENYKAGKLTKFKKAEINYQSNKTARIYRTAITEAYSGAKEIDFAGYYILCFWGCGTGCMDGAMVDVRDGKVYDIPLGEENYYVGCNLASPSSPTARVGDDDDCCLMYSDDSRLFISQKCSEYANTDTANIQAREHFINVWNEKTKRFEFVKSVKSEKIVPADE